MAEPATILDDVTSLHPDSSDQAQVMPPIRVWQRQPGESLLWYNRFKLYRNLGYKRSLVAALSKEQETAKVLKSTRIGKKPGVALAEVPRAQVPGSWKQASSKWRWVERAAAYDEYMIDQMVDGAIDDLLDGAGTSLVRVMLLKNLLEKLRVNFNANAEDMTPEQYCMWIQRMQSIMKQISDEMLAHDEATTRAIARHISRQVYQEHDPTTSKRGE